MDWGRVQLRNHPQLFITITGPILFMKMRTKDLFLPGQLNHFQFITTPKISKFFFFRFFSLLLSYSFSFKTYTYTKMQLYIDPMETTVIEIPIENLYRFHRS